MVAAVSYFPWQLYRLLHRDAELLKVNSQVVNGFFVRCHHFTGEEFQMVLTDALHLVVFLDNTDLSSGKL